MRVGTQRRFIVPPALGPPVGPSTFFSAKQCEVRVGGQVNARTCPNLAGVRGDAYIPSIFIKQLIWTCYAFSHCVYQYTHPGFQCRALGHQDMQKAAEHDVQQCGL